MSTDIAGNKKIAYGRKFGKLKVYVQVYDSECYAKANLPANICGMMVELKAGCLPLQVELIHSAKHSFQEKIRKFMWTKLEDQEHFLLRCNSLKAMRAKVWSTISSWNQTFSLHDDSALY